jgi:formate hydrogenlyase subunit 3/multisubunit Na+/H+ antiporter MnhD subunit
MGTSALIAGALLVDERTVQALLLFLMALIASGTIMVHTRASSAVGGQARKFAGGLKHLALVSVATVLLVAGATMLDRYGLSLERRALLQFGLSLLSVGLLVRVGAMPFAGAASDTMRAAPAVAILMIGATVPTTLGVGLLMLAPVEGSLVSASQTAWVAAVGVLLAGVRALGISDFGFRISDFEGRQRAVEVGLPVLGAMSVAAQVGWAMFGVLSGSRMGATGAVLLAANIAIAVPLLIVSSQKEERSPENPKSKIQNPKSKIGIMVGAASLLGLPPFGGFAGTVMVAQAAANIGGIWLGVLLLGTLLVGVAWTWIGIGSQESGVGAAESEGLAKRIWGTTPLLIIVLITIQLGLFLMSGQIADALGNWAGAPWMFAP